MEYLKFNYLMYQIAIKAITCYKKPLHNGFWQAHTAVSKMYRPSNMLHTLLAIISCHACRLQVILRVVIQL
jgi:hypothetical protein